MTADHDAAPVPQSMVVMSCNGDGGVRSERRPVPLPGPGELLLALRYCGLCGTDLFKLVNRSVAAGAVLGHELVGSVAAVGHDTAGFSHGDRVVVPHHVACAVCALCQRGSHTLCHTFKQNLMTPGGFSEYVLIRARAVAVAARRLSDGLDDEAAVFLEPAACVLRGIRKAAVPKIGGCVLVMGAGSMGLLHLLVLKALSPETVVVLCDPLDERQKRALELGADAACAPRKEELEALVLRSSQGLGADAVFDTVGGSGPLVLGMSLLRPGGTVVLFAHAAEGEQAGFVLNPFFKSEQRVVSTYSGSLEEQDEVLALLRDGALDPRPLVSHRLPLSQLQSAIDLAKQGQALKILLYPD